MCYIVVDCLSFGKFFANIFLSQRQLYKMLNTEMMSIVIYLATRFLLSQFLEYILPNCS